MTDSQTLLAEYARSGSESAFRELVARYLGLVYGTALRLVDGDRHLAEDVTQTVFLDLARKAGGLCEGVMLGGWLHRRTYHVAAPIMRAARRRQIREREAVEMHLLQEDPGADWAQAAPILDEAIMELGKEDRTAIILRFFERRDFRSIGQALGSTEDAARMRVNRALEKLHLLLEHRGVSLSVAALGTVLASEALTAAPVGLVASVTGTVLANVAGEAGISATLFKVMAGTKLKAAVITAVIITGVTTSLVIQHQAGARLAGQDEAVRQQAAELAQLAAENERLSSLVANTKNVSDQLKDLPKLRAEAASLRVRTNELGALREENRRLEQRTAEKAKTPLQVTEARVASLYSARNWMLAFLLYAEKNQGQLPTNFEQAASFMPPELKEQSSLSTDHFEIVYQGSINSLTNPDIIVLREKMPRQGLNGGWSRVYGKADGSSQNINMEIAEKYEKEHMIRSSQP